MFLASYRLAIHRCRKSAPVNTADTQIQHLSQSVQPSCIGRLQHPLHDKPYIALRNSRATLAVYRVRNDGILKRLRRWPAALDEL
jgi:hypothetical protein